MIRWILTALILLPVVAYYISSLLIVPADELILPQQQVTTVLADDGPYAFFDETETALTVKWLCEQQIVVQQQSVTEPIVPRCAYHKPIKVRAANQVAIPERAEATSLAVLSDIHGQYQLMQQLLQANHIVDKDGNWSFADGHLIVIGDVMDRGDQVTEILWWLYQLEQQQPDWR